MSNFYTDNDDLRFYVDHAIEWPALVEAVELNFHAPDAPKNWQEAVESYRDVLNLVGEFSAEQIAPRARLLETQGVHMVDGVVQHGPAHHEIFSQFKELGLYGMSLPREIGGINGPTMLHFLSSELMARGDPAVMAHFGFHAGVASVMMDFSRREGSTKIDERGRLVSTRWDSYVREILAGNAWGSMDLTESGAGSDLAAIRTRARKDKDGVWRVTGNKIFITSGHGRFHFVLAKTEDKPTLDALSLFLVPLTLEKDGQVLKNGYVDRVEEKCGQHGSATCSIQYEDSLADLVGQEGEGFKLMLLLMNNARISVGFESTGVMECAYRMAKAYAADRKSMGKPIAEHEMIADYLDEMDVTIKAVRAMSVDAAWNEEMATRLEILQSIPSEPQVRDPEVAKRIRRCKRRARLLTPLVKYLGSEGAVWATRMNMQIHGGYGYVKDYDAERLLRDSLVLPIYEGTSQIQSLMALKDHLQSAMRNPQGFVSKLAAAKLGAVRARDPLERQLNTLKSLSYSAQQHILLRVAKTRWSAAMAGPLAGFLDAFKQIDPRRDFAFGLLHAERLTRILADTVAADILVEQAKKFPERRELAERWMERAEPRVRYNWEMISTTGDRILARLNRDRAESAPSTGKAESAKDGEAQPAAPAHT